MILTYKAQDNKIKRMCEHNKIVKITKNLFETIITIPGYLIANAVMILEAVYISTNVTYKKYASALETFTYRDASF